MHRRHELTDEQWTRIAPLLLGAPLLPGKVGDRGRLGVDNRRFVNAVLFVAKTGIPWRDLPERFGRWNTVWRRFDRWCASGVRARLAEALGDNDLDELHLDQQASRRSTRRSARARGPTKKDEADRRRCLGRSRGGWTTKLHAAVSGRGRAIRLQLTPGQAGDVPRAGALRPRHVVADAANDSDAIRHQLRRSKARACIRPNPTRRVKKRYDRARYRNRNVIERFFGAIKRFRRVATRDDKNAENSLGFARLAALLVGHL